MTDWSEIGAFYEDILFLEGSVNKEGNNEMHDQCSLYPVLEKEHICDVVLSLSLRLGVTWYGGT